MSPRSQRGSLLPLVALVVVFVGVLTLGLARMAAVAVARAQARTAADAAALAGAADGSAVAREVADRNGGRLVRFETDGPDVEVTVEIGPARATARARALDAGG